MSRRRILATLGVTAVAATAVIAAPTGDTQARWTETRTSVVPRMTMGTPTLTPTDVPVVKPFSTALQATLKNNAGYGLEYRPTQLTITKMPGTLTTDSDVTGLLAYGYGIAYDYTNCAGVNRWQIPQTDGGTATTTYTIPATGAVRDPLVKGATAPMCIIVRPDASDRQRYVNFAGREYQLTTTLRAVSVAGTATTSPTWTTRYVIPIPSAFPDPSGTSCGGTWIVNNIHFYWAWPDSTMTSATGYSAINHWDILARPKGSTATYKVVDGGIVGTKREEIVGTGDLVNAGYTAAGEYEFIVRAYPFAGSTTKYSESTVRWNAYYPGSSGYFACRTSDTNPTAGMYGY